MMTERFLQNVTVFLQAVCKVSSLYTSYYFFYSQCTPIQHSLSLFVLSFQFTCFMSLSACITSATRTVCFFNVGSLLISLFFELVMLWSLVAITQTRNFTVIAFTDANMYATLMTQRNVFKAAVPDRMIWLPKPACVIAAVRLSKILDAHSKETSNLHVRAARFWNSC